VGTIDGRPRNQNSHCWIRQCRYDDHHHYIIQSSSSNAYSLLQGKTTTLYKMQVGEVVVTQPTIGSNVGEVSYKNIKFHMWDLGGQESLRPSWTIYFVNTQAVILVVDSTDRKRIHLVKQELFNMLENNDLVHSKILILANKQDVKNCMNVAELTQSLNLFKIKTHEWYVYYCHYCCSIICDTHCIIIRHIEPACALTGDGLAKGLDWLVERLKR
jgi:small GTP-binding protein